MDLHLQNTTPPAPTQPYNAKKNHDAFAGLPLPEAQTLPCAMLAERRWCCWKVADRGGKLTKVPTQPDGRPAKSNDPSTWVPWEEAAAAARRHGWGVGFMLGDDWIGVDLDHCRQPETGHIEPWALGIIDQLRSYTESSPSGTGVHVICRGTLPPGRRRKGPIEMYDAGRFFTVSGARLNEHDVADRTAELASLHAEIFASNGRSPHTDTERRAAEGNLNLDDEQLLQRALESQNGQRFRALWEGRWQGEYSSQSEADLALCSILAFWCGGDAARIDRLFRRSGLYRQKWERSDYRESTIAKALEGPKGFYQPGRRNGDEPRRTATAATAEDRDWKARLITNAAGGFRPILANAITAFREAPDWCGVFGYDEFAARTVMLHPAPWIQHSTSLKFPAEWTTADDILATEWMHRHGIYVSLEITGQAIEAVARDHKFHPVRSWLNSLEWDGIPRLDWWLTNYCGVEWNAYSRAVGTRWMISAVARIFQPGVKADCCLVLEGPQGIGKSAALRALSEPYFTDDIGDFGAINTKDAALQTAGVWVIELAELDALSRAEASRVKAFLSRSVDRFRPPYGKRVIEFPRQCVFAGTVNLNAYLKDETGGRRFWPVKCQGTIDVKGISMIRERLWAEAVVRYRKGEIWWLDEEDLITAALDEQAQRFDSDPWETVVSEWVADRDSVAVGEVLGDCLEKPRGSWSQADKNRIARILRSMGWERTRVREGKGLTWRYTRP